MRIEYLHSLQALYSVFEHWARTYDIAEIKQGLKFDPTNIFLAFMKNDVRGKNTETALTRFRM